MDREFHYWITGLIAQKAGFTDEEAHTIAYSSEFVDENDVEISVKVNKDDDNPYRNFISQTMNILKPKNKLMKVYPLFHFVPGEPSAKSAWRTDGKMHLLCATPDNKNAREMLDRAFASDPEFRLYRIGIASHCYVDTWAHQNFVGWFDDYNNIGMDPKPDIGHANAEHHPDWIGHKWVDNRLTSPEISNTNRFLSASKALYEKYRSHLKSQKRKSTPWNTLQKQLINLMGKTYTGNSKKYEEERIKKYKEATGLPEFNEKIWREKAIRTKVNGFEDSDEGLKSIFTIFKDDYFWKNKNTYKKTDWFKFQQAVKAHEKDGLAILKPLFNQMGIEIKWGVAS